MYMRPDDDGTWQREDFENAYRNWLVDIMGAQRYCILFDLMYDTPFFWSPGIPLDEDRAINGRYLRRRFAEESGMFMLDSWLEEGWPCSFLEFLVALSYSIDDRITYDPEKPGQAAEWFWEMLGNLGLAKYEDSYMLRDGMLAHFYVSEILDRVMARRYESDGFGGLFPLEHPEMDQRKVEIWYQANAYMIEKEY